MALLEIEGVRAGYGPTEVLHGISLQIEENECVATLGRNGAGKTTLLRTISGLQRAARGLIRFEEREIQRLPPDRIARLGIAHVQEARRLFRRLSTEDNLRLGGQAVGRSHRDVGKSLEQAYEFFPLLRRKRRDLAGWLSGGEQQMLAIGQALMARPRLLLLDEPSAGLAPSLVAQLLEQTLPQLMDQGITIILAEQHVAKALHCSQRAYLLEQGSIACSGPSDALLNDRRVVEVYMRGESC